MPSVSIITSSQPRPAPVQTSPSRAACASLKTRTSRLQASHQSNPSIPTIRPGIQRMARPLTTTNPGAASPTANSPSPALCSSVATQIRTASTKAGSPCGKNSPSRVGTVRRSTISPSDSLTRPALIIVPPTSTPIAKLITQPNPRPRASKFKKVICTVTHRLTVLSQDASSRAVCSFLPSV